jgi:hypothetical protein
MKRHPGWLILPGLLVLGSAWPALAQQKLDAELKGISAVGLVVEDLTSQAAACGLKQDAIEGAASKILADAGLKIVRNSDNDTYVYLNVQTTSVPTGLCVSRYDVSLYTHTTARLSYQTEPLLVTVSLIHEGALAGGSAAGHGASLIKSLMQYVDQVAGRIRRANSTQ